jgi:tol-pal system protein YbgF
MTRITPPCAAGLIAVWLAAVPVHAQNREHQQMAADVRMLQEQTQLLSLSIAQTLARLGELGESLKKIEARLDAAETASRKATADQKLTFDALSTDVRIIREGTQNVNARIGLLNEEVEALRTSLPSLVSQSGSQGGGIPAAAAALLSGVPGAPGDAAPTPSAPPVQRSGLTPTRLFQAAMDDYTSANYSLAISGFQQLLQEYPTSELADDAQYYIGYSHLSQRRYPEAIKAFSDLVRTYPTGDKVPEAYFDLGQAHNGNGDVEAARTAWQTVITQFPTSNSAIIAKQRLNGLPRPTTPQKP